MVSYLEGGSDWRYLLSLPAIVIYIIAVAGLFMISIQAPMIAEQQQAYDNEKEFVRVASCDDLNQFIIDDLEGKIDRYNANVELAKQLHIWKCQ